MMVVVIVIIVTGMVRGQQRVLKMMLLLGLSLLTFGKPLFIPRPAYKMVNSEQLQKPLMAHSNVAPLMKRRKNALVITQKFLLPGALPKPLSSLDVIINPLFYSYFVCI